LIIVLTGPTASGKTKASIALAKALGGVIINGDAFQVYQELSIATAKPTVKQLCEAPHYLFDFIPLNEDYNVYEYQLDLRSCVAELLQKNIPMIIAGGTGLYIRAGLYDYQFSDDSHVDMSGYESQSDQELHAFLESIDPESAAKIHPNNRRRVLRAIEIYLQTGVSKSSIEATQEHAPLYDVKFFTLDQGRSTLYERVEQRVDEMFELGLENEVRTLVDKYGRDISAFKAIGVKEFFPYLDGQCSLEEVRGQIISNTKKYVKRQETFFRHQFPSTWVKDEQEILSLLSQK